MADQQNNAGAAPDHGSGLSEEAQRSIGRRGGREDWKFLHYSYYSSSDVESSLAADIDEQSERDFGQSVRDDDSDDDLPTGFIQVVRPAADSRLPSNATHNALLLPFAPPRGYVLIGTERAEPFNTPNLVAATLPSTTRYVLSMRDEQVIAEEDQFGELPRSFPARMTDGINGYPHITAAHAREQFYIDLRNLDPERSTHVYRNHRHDIYADDPVLREAHAMIPDYKTMNSRFHAKNKSFAYVTIITNASYLPGVIVLLHTIRKSGGVFPLVVLYTRNLSATAVAALEYAVEDSRNMLEIYCIEPLLPTGHHNINVAHPRFADTWTKLRVFQLYNRFTTVAYLDADMVMTMNDNIDYIFEYARWLPKNCIAAVHDCTCGQECYGPDECVFTYQRSPDADYSHITARESDTGPVTLFNSGMFLFHPSKQLWEAIKYYFDNSTKLGSFRFPDQDFLVTFFKYRWTGMPWQWMAVKTMAVRHSKIFRMERANIIHYIVDKPWSKRVEKGDPGGEESPLHHYWFERYDQWCAQMQREGKWALLSIVSKHVGDRKGHRRIDDELLPPVFREAPPWEEKYQVVELEELPPFRGYHRAAEEVLGAGSGVVVSWAEGVVEEDEEEGGEVLSHVK